MLHRNNYEEKQKKPAINIRSQSWFMNGFVALRPFREKTSTASMMLILHDPVPSIQARNRDITTKVEAVLLRALDKDYEQRFFKRLEFAIALEQAYTYNNSEPTQQLQSQIIILKRTISADLPVRVIKKAQDEAEKTISRRIT